MSSDDPGGFLSRMARLVRRPGGGWADSDGPAPPGGGPTDRQSLKEAIERKKRNDFVRKREFDMLRAIRQREQQGGREAVARPSFFQSSHPAAGNDGREMTMRKIDQIEAQMSTHWWQQKPGDDRPAPEILQAPPLDPQRRPAGPAHLQARAFDESDWGGTVQGGGLPTQPALEEQWPSAARASGRRARSAGGHSTLPVTFGDDSQPSGPDTQPAGDTEPLSPTAWAGLANQACRELPVLEAAALHFISREDAPAEQLLREAVTQAQGAEALALTRAVLLDFFRATDRSAPFQACLAEWGATGQAVPPLAWAPLVGSGDASPVQPLPVWACPPLLDARALVALEAHLKQPAAAHVIDWSALSATDPETAAQLLVLCEALSDEARTLHWVGHANLRRRLQASTPSGRRENHTIWWRLRLAVLRLTGRSDEFDLTALDYCVTYGVTPPDWAAPACRCEQHERWPPEGDGAAHAVLRLAGELQGDLAGPLDALDRAAGAADVLRIDCSALVRTDLVAAGALLQWAAAQKGRRRRVVFERLHRLLAIALHVVGVDEAVQLRVRVD